MIPDALKERVILVVLDGWGIAPPNPGNAIAQANTVNMTRLWSSYPHTQLNASSDSVGLPRGEAGNTETGHLNIGAGKIVYQDLAKINMSIADGSFYENKALIGAIDHAIKYNSNLHYMGLLGAGGVHSNIEHLFALIYLAKRKKFDRVYLHLFTDGRDSPTTAAMTYINSLRLVIKKEGIGIIASIMGRYWAMDRDLRWDRTAKAYFALTKGQGSLVKTPEEALEMSYSQGKTDEFVIPSLISDKEGRPVGLIKDNDAIVFFNFRIDRPRQLSKAFVFKDFVKGAMEWDFDPYSIKYEKRHETVKKAPQNIFDRGVPINNLYFATMTEYGKPLVKNGAHVAYPPEVINMPIGRVISINSKRQLRITESEKERFVTFYFNGQREEPFDGEDRVIIPSAKVPTYDSKPDMSANEITDKLLEKLKFTPDYSFVLVNFPNADMVGHTGNIGPTVKACEVVDECVGKLANYVLAYGGTLIITSDHGNAEEMINSHTGQIDTEHSTNKVPFIAVSKEFLGKSIMLPTGILADISPTVLSLLSLEAPTDMTGRNLLKELI